MLMCNSQHSPLDYLNKFSICLILFFLSSFLIDSYEVAVLLVVAFVVAPTLWGRTNAVVRGIVIYFLLFIPLAAVLVALDRVPAWGPVLALFLLLADIGIARMAKKAKARAEAAADAATAAAVKADARATAQTRATVHMEAVTRGATEAVPPTQTPKPGLEPESERERWPTRAFSLAWIALIGLAVALAAPLYRMESFSYFLLLIPPLGLLLYLLEGRMTRRSPLHARLTLLSCALLFLVLRSARQFLFGDPKWSPPLITAALAFALLPAALAWVRTDRRRWQCLAGAAALALVAMALPLPATAGRHHNLGLASNQPIWTGPDKNRAICPAFYLNSPQPPDTSRWRGLRDDKYDRYSYDCYLVDESGRWKSRRMDESCNYTLSEIEGKPAFYDSATGALTLLDDAGQLLPPLTLASRLPKFQQSAGCVSPEARHMLFSCNALEGKDGPEWKRSALGVVDLDTATTRSVGAYSERSFVRWEGPDTLLLFVQPPWDSRATSSPVTCETRLIDVCTGEDTLLQEIHLERQRNFGGFWRGDYILYMDSLQPLDPPASNQVPEPRIIDIHTGSATSLPPIRNHDECNFDGKSGRAAFTSQRGDLTMIVVADPSGVSAEPEPAAGWVPQRLHLSPDGKRLAILEGSPSRRFATPCGRIRVVELSSGKSSVLDYVNQEFLPVGWRPWDAYWSPNSHRLAYSASRTNPLRLRWWLIHRRAPDVLEFVSQALERFTTGPRDCGSGLVTGPPFPSMPDFEIVDLP